MLSKRVAKAREGYTGRKLNGLEFKGLMDSGATISCLGKNCIENVSKMKCHIINFKSNIKPADGKNQLIIGKVKLFVECVNVTQEMLFYMVHNLKQNLILGYDF